MTREQKFKKAIEMGYICNPETGQIFNKNGIELKRSVYGYKCFSITIDSKKYNIYAHQFIYYYFYNMIVDEIDHINRDKFDSRISNLRSVTRSENKQNINCKGYYWTKAAKKWQVGIRINGKTNYIGLFNTEQEASKAYLDAKKIYHNI